MEKLSHLYSASNRFRDLKDWNQSFAYLEKAQDKLDYKISIRPLEPNYYSFSAQIFNEFGNIFLAQKQYKKSLQYFEQAIEIQLKSSLKNSSNLYQSYKGIGNAFLELEKYQSAYKSYQQAITEINNITNEKELSLSLIESRIGILLQRKKQFKKALKQHQLSLSILGAAIPLDDWKAFPDNFPTHFPEGFFLLLEDKIETLEKVFTETNDLKYLATLIDHYQYIIDYTEHIKKHKFKNISQTYWAKKSNNISNKYIQAVLDYSRLTDDPSYAEKAFSISDQNKAAMLRAAFREAEAISYSHIPDSIVAKEEQFKKNIVGLEKKIFDRISRLSQIDRELDLKLQAWHSKLYYLKTTHQQLKIKIAKNYPDFFQAKYDLTPINLPEIQKNLHDSTETIIEYSIADSVIYAFAITKDSYQVFMLPKSDSLDKWVIDLRESIYGYWMNNEKTDSSYNQSVKTYTLVARKLYQSILEPIFQKNNYPKKLTIIPDGVLGYVPFEILLTQTPVQIGRFGDYPFFIKETEISYAFSVKLQLEMDHKKVNPSISKILAIAPTFDQNEDWVASSTQPRQNLLFPLKYNIEEVKYLLKNFDTQMKTNQLANKTQFLELAPYFRFIHLATHAKVHGNDSKFSYIAFTEMADSLPKNNLLYLSEIYNLTLNAEMVVLSACETGIGELQKGEGIISMARSFAYAGAKSIVTSLWSVDDRSTADIMKNFYNHLDHGERKSQALRNAKLDYIGNNDDKANHPFFWAPMIAMGDMEAVELNDKTNNWAWILGLCVIGWFVVVFFGKKIKFQGPL